MRAIVYREDPRHGVAVKDVTIRPVGPGYLLSIETDETQPVCECHVLRNAGKAVLLVHLRQAVNSSTLPTRVEIHATTEAEQQQLNDIDDSQYCVQVSDFEGPSYLLTPQETPAEIMQTKWLDLLRVELESVPASEPMPYLLQKDPETGFWHVIESQTQKRLGHDYPTYEEARRDADRLHMLAQQPFARVRQEPRI